MAWWKYAKAGDKIVCIDDGPLCVGIKRGNVYTISEIRLGDFTDTLTKNVVFNEVGILLIERPAEYFRPRRFRPIQKHSTDKGMSILRSILNGQKIVENA